MREVKRLLDEDASPLEMRLLKAGRPAPPAAVKAGVLAGVKLAIALKMGALVVAVVVMGGLATFAWVGTTETPPTVTATPPTTEAAPTTVTPPAIGSATSEPGAVRVSERNRAQEEQGRVRIEKRSEVPSRLKEEAQRLETARRTLASGNAKDALDQLQHVTREFGASPLAEEREVLIIEALVALDAWPRAEAAAKAFLRDHPNSAYAGKVKRLVEL